jgi:hypothetical protein
MRMMTTIHNEDKNHGPTYGPGIQETPAAVDRCSRAWKSVTTRRRIAWAAVAVALISVVVVASASSWIRRDSSASPAERITAPRPSAIVEQQQERLQKEVEQQPEQQRGSTEVVVAAAEMPTTYRPGNLSVRQHGLRLSAGLSATVVARSGQRIRYDNGELSNDRFHDQPDGAATYADTRSYNRGGWVYVSNSEVRDGGGGGVGAITFNRHGQPIHYQMLLKNTRSNCGGGKTSWGAWISGEEFPNTGRIWQVDPFNEHDPVPITMGNVHKGLFESFAYDDRNKSTPRFFMTKDDEDGALRRLYVRYYLFFVVLLSLLFCWGGLLLIIFSLLLIVVVTRCFPHHTCVLVLLRHFSASSF